MHNYNNTLFLKLQGGHLNIMLIKSKMMEESDTPIKYPYFT